MRVQGPVVTDNGNLLLDWLFPEGDHDWKDLSVQLKMIPGEPLVPLGRVVGTIGARH